MKKVTELEHYQQKSAELGNFFGRHVAIVTDRFSVIGSPVSTGLVIAVNNDATFSAGEGSAPNLRCLQVDGIDKKIPEGEVHLYFAGHRVAIPKGESFKLFLTSEYVEETGSSIDEFALVLATGREFVFAANPKSKKQAKRLTNNQIRLQSLDLVEGDDTINMVIEAARKLNL